MDMRNSFIVLFFMVLEKFSGKKIRIIIHIYIYEIFFVRYAPGMEIIQLNVFNLNKNLEDFEKNLEKRIPA
jgi:hypothetical protein